MWLQAHVNFSGLLHIMFPCTEGGRGQEKGFDLGKNEAFAFHKNRKSIWRLTKQVHDQSRYIPSARGMG